MEEIGSTAAVDMAIGQRLLVIFIFLLALWAGLNYLVMLIKSGKLVLPEFLRNKMKLDPVMAAHDSELYSLKLVQRKVMPDGTELWVVDIDGKHSLMSWSATSGIRFLKDLTLSEDKCLDRAGF